VLRSVDCSLGPMEVAGSGVFGRGSCVLLEMGQAADGEGIAAGLSVWLYAAAGADQQAKARATLSPSQR
jgi:hypothetical protein